MTLFVETLRGLVAPRRSFPILILAIPLLLAQRAWSASTNADLLAAGMVAIFLLIGPWSYRAFRGELGFRASLREHGWFHPAFWLRLGAFLAAGALPAALGMIAEALAFTDSFLTSPTNLLVLCALGWVGSWGLGRDLENEVRLLQERARADQLQREAEHARLMAVDAHLDPHFLFNTLNAIAEWVREDPAHAERAILDLSALLREILDGVHQPDWDLRREIALAQGVWRLHGIRDPGRYHTTYDLPDPLPPLQVPPLFLLPLVENAVKHGPAAGHRGPLGLAVSDQGTAWRIEVSNPGPWTGSRPGGKGLDLARKRLALRWGPRARLDLAARQDRTYATLHIPKESA
jgi:hypothetical protein